jgi:hypothetical protein
MKIGNDLKVSLSLSMIPPVQRWIQRFIEAQHPRFGTPALINEVLQIHPQDAVDLIHHFADPDEMSEFELHRLKALLVVEMSRKLTRCRNDLVKRAYDECLTTLTGTNLSEISCPSNS